MSERNSILESVDQAMAAGMFLTAHDRAMNGLEHSPDDIPLKHRAVLSIARSGNINLASELFERFFDQNKHEFDDNDLIIEIGSLKGRLLKDRGLGADTRNAEEYFQSAAKAYQEVFERTGEAYPGANAASLWLWANEPTKAKNLAHACLNAKTSFDFYGFATMAEAYLVLGDVKNAELMIKRALACNPGTDMRVTAYRQLRRNCKILGLDPAIISPFRPGPVVRFLGHMPWAELDDHQERQLSGAITAEIRKLNPEVFYGSLAAGADIIIAECALTHGIDLHIILPLPVKEFVRISVRPFGEQWVKRFEKCIGASSSLNFSCETEQIGDRAVLQYCSRYTLGVVLQEAQNKCSEPFQLAIWDETAEIKPGGTGDDVQFWAKSGRPQILIAKDGKRVSKYKKAPISELKDAPQSSRQIRAVLFGDFVGFSKISDWNLEKFVDVVLADIADVLSRFEDEIICKNTWGDGLFIVFNNVAAAGRASLAIAQSIAKFQDYDDEAIQSIQLRLGMHVAPMTEISEPITNKTTFFGSEISKAARVEPVTPPGVIFVTEAFAAYAQLEENPGFRCEYMGKIQLAKSSGTSSIFRLIPPDSDAI